MRCWTVRAHLAGLVALAAAACARGERVPVAGGVVVTDDAGRRVTLAAPARRVVSLLPSFTEILFAIGAGRGPGGGHRGGGRRAPAAAAGRRRAAPPPRLPRPRPGRRRRGAPPAARGPRPARRVRSAALPRRAAGRRRGRAPAPGGLPVRSPARADGEQDLGER